MYCHLSTEKVDESKLIFKYAFEYQLKEGSNAQDFLPPILKMCQAVADSAKDIFASNSHKRFDRLERIEGKAQGNIQRRQVFVPNTLVLIYSYSIMT